MILLGIDPSLSMTGLVIAYAHKNSVGAQSICVKKRTVIKTKPSRPGLSGADYEKDVILRSGAIARGIYDFINDIHDEIDAVVVESVPFARGWKSGVAANSLKGTIGATLAFFGIDNTVVVISPKAVKKGMKIGRSYVDFYKDKYFDGNGHDKKDFVVAWIARNYPLLCHCRTFTNDLPNDLRQAKIKDGCHIFDNTTRLEREAIADAFGVVVAYISKW